MSSQHLYIAAIDGSLRYDCAHCGAHCCRHGTVSVRIDREGPAMFDLQPEMAALVQARVGHFALLGPPPGPCPALTSENRCRLHALKGRAAKPASCVTFPFSPVLRLGDLLVVRPNFLCPLTEAGQKSRGTRHSAVAKDVEAVGWHEAPLPERAPAEGSAEAWRQNEVAFREKCAGALRAPSVPRLLEADGPPEEELFLQRMASLLGWTVPPPGGADRILTLLAPALRTLLIADPEPVRCRTLLLLWLGLAQFPHGSLADSFHFLRNLLPAARAAALGQGDGTPFRRDLCTAPLGAPPGVRLAAVLMQQALARGMSGLHAFAQAVEHLLDLGDRMAVLHFVGRYAGPDPQDGGEEPW